MKKILLLLAVSLLLSCSGKNTALPAVQTDPKIQYIAQYTGTTDVSITNSGFESADDFSGYFTVPQNHMETASHELSQDNIYGGNFAHKGWIYGANTVIYGTNTNHRGYPTVQMYKDKGVFSGPVFIELMVWLDIALEEMENKNWFSFVTLCTYSDDSWYRVITANISYNHNLHLFHVPNQGEHVIDIYENDAIAFPMRQWVKITMLVDFSSQNQYSSPYAKLWQDGVLVSAATFNPRINPPADSALWPACLSGWDGNDVADAESMCSLTYEQGLAQAHFGLYAAPLLSSGTAYNDNLKIYELLYH
ncbi:MAG: hypothetical protein CVV21_11245 [Candidatus Goldiibacteriota bacterium HGW-Goldbacteria-1]|jgi:hypothetical protein|nr:MAG: hypothetical protein CVV21_11245 [Candidatus Goldiibacteriota bacterium HGW-Goldbacteria-1]